MSDLSIDPLDLPEGREACALIGPGERTLYGINCNWENLLQEGPLVCNGVVVATDKRLFFYHAPWGFGSAFGASAAYTDIASIKRLEDGWFGGASFRLHLTAGHRRRVLVSSIQIGDVEALVDLVQSKASGVVVPKPKPAAPSSPGLGPQSSALVAGAAKHLEEGETIVQAESCIYVAEGRETERNPSGEHLLFKAVAVATDRRLMVYVKQWLVGESLAESMRYSVATSVDDSTVMLDHRVVVRGPGTSVVTMSSVSKGFVAFLRSQIERAQAAAAPAAAAPAAAAPADAVATSPVEQLEKLGALRASGVLTEEEFATAKAAVLAKM